MQGFPSKTVSEQSLNSRGEDIRAACGLLSTIRQEEGGF